MSKKDGLQTINCSFCGSPDHSLHYQEDEWKVVKCSNCGFVYTNPQPTPEALPYYYTEDYFKDKRHKSKFYNEDGSQKIIIEDYSNRIIDIENNVNSRGRLLEIGSARGGFLSVMRDRGWTVEGVEISSDAAELAQQKGIETYVGIFDNFEPKQLFDAICLYQTLEHVHNPKGVLNKAFELLNPDGVLVVEVPNVKCFEFNYSKERKHLSYDLPRHLSHFDPKLLKQELEKMGFVNVHYELYPPKNLLRILHFINARKGKHKTEENTSKAAKSETNLAEIPLMKRPLTSKGKLVTKYSGIFPGWRFTIYAHKP